MTGRDAGNLEQFLREEGAPDTVVRGGLEVLLAGWERTVAAVEGGYGGDYEDFLGDLDGRQLLAQALERVTREQAAHFTARLAELDGRFRAVTTPVARCLWGNIVADEEGWSPDDNWWYFVRPLRGPEAFLAEFPAA
ncbi:MAG TPA: hypothetical protein PKA66_07760 [Gemmatimonadales bacterium]|nr:hypothetical protein [Gemmatimonadales bacterium]